jgi:hypothetical protein
LIPDQGTAPQSGPYTRPSDGQLSFSFSLEPLPKNDKALYQDKHQNNGHQHVAII